MSDLVVGPYEDWLWLDERIETITAEIEKIANCPKPDALKVGNGPHLPFRRLSPATNLAVCITGTFDWTSLARHALVLVATRRNRGDFLG